MEFHKIDFYMREDISLKPNGDKQIYLNGNMDEFAKCLNLSYVSTLNIDSDDIEIENIYIGQASNAFIVKLKNKTSKFINIKYSNQPLITIKTDANIFNNHTIDLKIQKTQKTYYELCHNYITKNISGENGIAGILSITLPVFFTIGFGIGKYF